MDKIRKKWMAVLLMFSMIATLCVPVSGKAQNALLETVPEGYIGIYDIADLYGIRNDLTANYILMNDIDMSEDTAEGGDWNLTGHGWTPIDGFAGTFDGNGHRIIGMHIYGEMEMGVGLFGKLNYPPSSDKKVIIRNLAMIDIAINIKGKDDNRSWCSVGGIVGHGHDEVKIEKCYTTGDILTDIKYNGSVGGLIGDGGYSSISNSYNGCSIILSGEFSSTEDGVAGIAKACKAEYCYNIGAISKMEGSDESDAYSIVDNRFANAFNCYALSGTANTNTKNCTVLFPTQLKDKRTLVGFDFDNVWEIDPYCDYPYPQLKSNRQIRIVSVDIVTEPTKTEYEMGDLLDVTDGTIKISYEDETTATIPITEDMVSGYDMNLTGEQMVKVTYCGVSTFYPIAVKGVSLTGITLDQSNVSLERNKTLQLSVSYMPSNASNKTVTWTSSDSTIASVDSDGLVRAKNKGIATITATSANGLMAQCQIYVLVPCVNITLDKTEVAMLAGGSYTLTAQMLPLDTTDMLAWKSSNPAVAGISSDGTVTAYSTGTATITASADSGITATCTVTVVNSGTIWDSDGNIISQPDGNTGTNTGNNTGVNSTMQSSAITSVKGKIVSLSNVSSTSIKLTFGNLGVAEGYQVEYSLNGNFGDSKKVQTKGTAVTIKKLKKGKKYYVRARVYGKINGETYYGQWSDKKAIKASAKSVYMKRYKELEKRCKREFNYDVATMYELREQAGQEFKLWDKELNYVYKKISKELKSSQKKKLKKSQKKMD